MFVFLTITFFPCVLPSLRTALSTLMSSHNPFHILVKMAITRKKKQTVIFSPNTAYCNHPFFNDKVL